MAEIVYGKMATLKGDYWICKSCGEYLLPDKATPVELSDSLDKHSKVCKKVRYDGQG